MLKYKKKPNGKNATGRPEKIKEEELRKLETAFKMGCNAEEARAFAEIPSTTYYDYLRNNPNFSQKIAMWRQNPVLKAKRTIYINLDNADTAKWYLERKCKEEFSTKQVIENEPIVQKVFITKEDAEEVEDYIDNVLNEY